VQIAGVGHALQGLGMKRHLTGEEGQLVDERRVIDQPIAMLGVARFDQLGELAQLGLGDVAP
jgi:hypothetical protein